MGWPSLPRRLGVLAVLLAALLTVIAARAAEPTYTFKLGGIHTQDNQQSRAMQKFAALVGEKSAGRVKVSLFWNSQLGDEPQLLQTALLPNFHDLAILSTTILTTVDRDVGVTNLPFLFRDEKHLADFELSPAFDAWRDAFIKNHGLRILGAWDVSFGDFATNRPVTRLSELKGLKIRVPPAADYVRILQLLGANPTPVPFGELYMSLQTGVVDGTNGDLDAILTGKFNEVTKYVSLCNFQVVLFNLIISEKYYQSLPADIQQTLNAAARETTIWNRQAYQKREVEAAAELNHDGIKLLKVTDLPQWRSAVQPLYDETAKRPSGQILTMIQDIK